jgi:hypothetical protein
VTIVATAEPAAAPVRKRERSLAESAVGASAEYWII